MRFFCCISIFYLSVITFELIASDGEAIVAGILMGMLTAFLTFITWEEK